MSRTGPPQVLADPLSQLAATLGDAMALLHAAAYAPEFVPAAQTNESTLLEQCLTLCAQHAAKVPEPIRTIHHFACTGGTLFSKCIAAMPNVQLLSELDPLSPHSLPSDKPRFSPTDMNLLLQQATRMADPTLLLEMFQRDLGAIYDASTKAGLRLVLRDHTHSHFCRGSAVALRPTFREIVAQGFAVLSVITVRHPLDSFAALTDNRWLQFQPQTADEYCLRYSLFLDAYPNVPIVRYEDFVADPHGQMQQICQILDLPYAHSFAETFSVFKLSGDSGRSANAIGTRAARGTAAQLSHEVLALPSYLKLVARLGYELERS